jgi:hypothetical protein
LIITLCNQFFNSYFKMSKIKLILSLIVFLSCSSNKIFIEPKDINNSIKKEYHLIMKTHESIIFNNFSVYNDTLVIIQSQQLLYKPDPLKIPFTDIEKIYIFDHPHRTISTVIFFGSILFGFIMLFNFYMNI